MESGDTTPYDRGQDSFEPEFDFRKNELSQIIERALKKLIFWEKKGKKRKKMEEKDQRMSS